LLTAAGHEPRRFEDFTVRPVPSRDACLTGLQEAEVYLLLLAKAYGEPMLHTGAAPRRRRHARVSVRDADRGVNKDGVTPEALQEEFIKRVGDYQQGRFWNIFNGTSDLGVAALAALRELGQQALPLRYEPVGQAGPPPTPAQPTAPAHGQSSPAPPSPAATVTRRHRSTSHTKNNPRPDRRSNNTPNRRPHNGWKG
jgi:hypothetical protein